MSVARAQSERGSAPHNWIDRPQPLERGQDSFRTRKDRNGAPTLEVDSLMCDQGFGRRGW